MLSSSYCGIWFVVDLLQRDDFHCHVAALYLYGGDLGKQSGFNKSKASDYGRQYVEDLGT